MRDDATDLAAVARLVVFFFFAGVSAKADVDATTSANNKTETLGEGDRIDILV